MFWRTLDLPDTTMLLDTGIFFNGSFVCAIILEGYRTLKQYFQTTDTFRRNFHHPRHHLCTRLATVAFPGNDLCRLVRKPQKFPHKFIGDSGVTCIDTSRTPLERVATRFGPLEKVSPLEKPDSEFVTSMFLAPSTCPAIF